MFDLSRDQKTRLIDALESIASDLKGINRHLSGIDSNTHGIEVEQEAATAALKSLAANYEATQICR